MSGSDDDAPVGPVGDSDDDAPVGPPPADSPVAHYDDDDDDDDDEEEEEDGVNPLAALVAGPLADDDDDDEESDGGEYDPTKGRRGRGGADDDDDDADDDIDDPEDDDDGDGDDDDGAKADDDHDEDEDDDDDEGPVRRKKTHAQKKRSRRVIDDDDDDDDDEEEEDVGEGDKDDSYNERKRRHESDGSELDSDDLELIKEAQEKALVQEGRSRKRAKDTEKKQKKKNKKQKTAKTAKLSAFAQQFVESSASVDKGDEDTESGAPPKKKKRRRDDFVADSDEDLEEDDDDALARFEAFDEEMASDEEDLSPPGSDEEEDDEEEGGDSDGDGGTAALLGGKSKKKKKKATGAAAPPASLRVDDEFGDFIEHDGSESEHSEDEEMDDGVRFEVDILKEGQNEALGIFGELYHGLLDGATALDADVEDDFDDGDYDRLNEEDKEIIEEGGDDADAATARMAERQRRREERRKERAIGLEQAYEPAELVRSLMTASDTLIRATDFPERLQSLQKLRQTHTEAHGAGFAEEAEWIYVNGFGGRPKSDDGSRRAARSLHRDVRSFIVDIREGSASGAVKGITNALRLIFQDGFEPAFVATYRVDDLLDLAQSYHSEVLPTEDIMLRLYVMLDWDERFLRLHAGKRRLLQLCDQVRDSLLEAEAYDGADRVVVETTRLALQDDAEEQAHLANGGIEVDHELADMEQRMVFYFADRINRAKKGTGQHQMPAQHTNYRHCLSSGVGAITRHYGIPVHKLGRNILLGKARHEIEESEQDPNDVAEEFVDPTVEMRKSSKRVLAMARYMVAQEIVFDPNIRAAARDSFFDLGSVTVRATAKGLKELDSHHPYSAFAFLTNKHLDEFKDDQFLHILRAEEQGLVNVYVRGERLLAGEDPASPAVASRCPEFVERAFRVYHETELDLWNPERRAALENAIVYGLFPQFAREARMALRKRAELHVLHQCFVDMLKRAMSPPVPRTLLPLRSDFGGDEVAYDAELRDYESSVCGTVAGCFIGDSRTPTFLAFINGNGVMMDFLKLDYLAKGRAAGASKLESDERRLREFIEAKRPSVVAVAANNLSDRRIFDQIAGIVGSVNDLKRHEARERKQEMLDEKREVDAAALKRKKSKKKAGAVTAELNPLDYELQPEDNAGFTPMQVRWADPSVPNIYGQSERSSKEFPQFPPVLCRAISVGRVVQDPLFEYASLSNIDHELTGVKVTPLQSLVGEELVEEWFERALVTAVARVGVDFNHVLRFPHREAALHLVAGFGLRKAQYLARGVQQRRQPIRTRLELRATPGVGECVYRNAAPFLKIVAPAHSHNDDDDMDEYEMEGVDDGDIVYDDDDDDDADDDDDGERRRARRRNQQRQRQRQRGGDEDEGEDDGDGDEIVVPEPLGYTEEEEEYFAVVHNDELDLNDIVENEELVKDADDDEDNVNFVEHQQLLVEKRKRLAEWEERERARIERAEAIEMAQERLRRRRERNEELERAKREKRLIHYVDVLDQTRVPPEAYDYARFIAKNAVESNETADDIRDDPSKHVARLLASRSDDSGAREILRLFDLADMALNYLRQKNVVQLLELIREELRDPFRDPRRRLEDVAGEPGAPESRTGNPYASVGAERLLTLFTGETLATLCKGRVVKGTVMRFSQRDKPTTTVRLDCGLQGIIPLSKLSRTRLAHPEERLSIGQVVEARIVELDPARMLAVLECRGDTMANPPPEMAPVRDAIYYDAPAEEAARASARAKKEAQHQAKMRRYKKRPIEHPLFRNVSLAAALALLEDPSVDAVFRPSSKGTDHLTVSWKFAEGEIVHEDIQELDKVNDVVLGRRLRILDEEYEDLDEIVVRRIQPSIAFSKAICGYKYFRSMQQSELKKMMEKEKSQYPSKTPYYFIIDRGHPKCFSLGCLPSRRVRFETVRVTADGYRYRQELHTSLQKLVGYFKRNINVAPPKRPTPAVASAKPQSTNNAMDDVSMGGGSSVGAWSGGGASSGGGGGYGDGSVRRPSRFDVGAPPSGTPSYFSDSYGGRQGAGAGAPPPMHPPPSSYLPPPPQRQQQQQQRPPSSYSTGGGQQYGQGTVGYDPYASQSSFSLPPPPHQYGGPAPPSGAPAPPPWRSGGAPPPPAPPGWVKEGASSSKPRY